MGSVELSTVVKSGACILSGTAFGFVLEKSSVYAPDVIRNAVLMTSGTPLKMWLAANATAMATLTLFPVVGGEAIVESAKADHCGKGQKTLSVIGGFIHGAGIVICGACPATVLVQLGTRTENSLYTFMGCLTGALVYGYMDSRIAAEKKVPSETVKRKCTIDDYFESGSYARFAVPVWVGLAAFLRHSDKYLPADVASGCGCPSIKHGVLLGLINIPILLTMKKMIGCSSSCVTLASQFVRGSLSTKYLDSFRSGFKKWWQVFFTGGAVAGAIISARAADSVGTVPGVSKTAAFIGGAVMIFGARVADGCVCGHGVTGVSLLSVTSLASTAAMVAGGFATVKAMQSLNVF